MGRLDISDNQALRHQSEILAKAEGQLAEGVRVNRENIEEMQVSLPKFDLLPRKEPKTRLHVRVDLVLQFRLKKNLHFEA